jgi:hypothetical protein
MENFIGITTYRHLSAYTELKHGIRTVCAIVMATFMPSNMRMATSSGIEMDCFIGITTYRQSCGRVEISNGGLRVKSIGMGACRQ